MDTASRRGSLVRKSGVFAEMLFSDSRHTTVYFLMLFFLLLLAFELVPSMQGLNHLVLFKGGHLPLCRAIMCFVGSETSPANAALPWFVMLKTPTTASQSVLHFH